MFPEKNDEHNILPCRLQLNSGNDRLANLTSEQVGERNDKMALLF